jgi:hypothetical protein
MYLCVCAYTYVCIYMYVHTCRAATHLVHIDACGASYCFICVDLALFK